MLASFHSYGPEPTTQALVISWCSLLNRLSPPCFHTSARIPYLPSALPSFRPAIALGISSMVGIPSLSPETFSSFWKCSSILPQLSCCKRMSPFHLLTSGEQVPSSWVPTLPSVHSRSPSCCFCQQLSAAQLPSFPTSLTSVHGCVFVFVCRRLCMLQWWI